MSSNKKQKKKIQSPVAKNMFRYTRHSVHEDKRKKEKHKNKRFDWDE